MKIEISIIAFEIDLYFFFLSSVNDSPMKNKNTNLNIFIKNKIIIINDK